MLNTSNENGQPGQAELLQRLVTEQDSIIELLRQQLHRSQQMHALDLKIITHYQALHAYHKTQYTQKPNAS